MLIVFDTDGMMSADTVVVPDVVSVVNEPAAGVEAPMTELLIVLFVIVEFANDDEVELRTDEPTMKLPLDVVTLPDVVIAPVALLMVTGPAVIVPFAPLITTLPTVTLPVV